MKVMKSFTISVENVERLKNTPNQSALIDMLLDHHFEIKQEGNMSEEELEVKIAKLEAKVAYEKAIERIEDEKRSGNRTRENT